MNVVSCIPDFISDFLDIGTSFLDSVGFCRSGKDVDTPQKIFMSGVMTNCFTPHPVWSVYASP